MPNISASTSQTERGNMSSFRFDDRVAYFLASTALTEHRIIGEAMQALSDGIATSCELIQARAPDLTSTGIAKLATETVIARITPPAKAVRSAITDATADVGKRVESLRAPFFTNDQPPAIRVELRQHAKSLSLPALMEAVQNDGALAAAIIEGGLAMSGLPADIFDRLKRDVAVANATRILLGQRTYRTAPNATDPLGGKSDYDAARVDGEKWIAALEVEQALLSDAPAALTAAIDVVAIMTDTTRDEAFKILLT